MSLFQGKWSSNEWHIPMIKKLVGCMATASRFHRTFAVATHVHAPKQTCPAKRITKPTTRRCETAGHSPILCTKPWWAEWWVSRLGVIGLKVRRRRGKRRRDWCLGRWGWRWRVWANWRSRQPACEWLVAAWTKGYCRCGQKAWAVVIAFVWAGWSTVYGILIDVRRDGWFIHSSVLRGQWYTCRCLLILYM